MTDKNKIFVWAVPVNQEKGIDQQDADFSKGIEHYNGDCLGYALAEDGEGLCSHYSSGIGFFRLDMGLASKLKHNIYQKKYPDGYELVELPYNSDNAEFLKALDINRKLAKPEDDDALTT